MFGGAFRLLYRIYASITVLSVIFLLFCPLIIVAPGLALRREIGRLCVRTALAMIFVPFRVRGVEYLPKQPCVAIANHASYLDGIIFTAALPHRFSFMVQDGAAHWPYVGLVIKRMGVRFINRRSTRDGARQVRRLIRDVRQGMSLAVFPEGKFEADPGLLRFHKGAFVIAAKAGVPVVTAAIRGTRHLFGGGHRLIAWSPVTVQFMPPLYPADDSINSATTLSEQARAMVLEHCGEPDRAES